MSEFKRAKLFWSGRSQVVRLPKEFRFDADEVSIRREGKAVILEPVEKPVEKSRWPEGFWEYLDSFGPVAEDFVRPDPLADAPHRDRVIEEWLQQLDEENR